MTLDLTRSIEQVVTDHIAEHGPWLYHETRVASLASIELAGILPADQIADETACLRWKGFWASRPGCVYLGMAQHFSGRWDTGDRIKVDLRLLDWSLLTADEDVCWIYDNTGCAGGFNPDLGIARYLPDCFHTRRQRQYPEQDRPALRTIWKRSGPMGQPPARENDNGRSFGQWAHDNARVLDSPAAVAASLALHHTVAYRGVISPECLTMPQLEEQIAA
jgi:hypothetical protein